ncbi:MAG: rod shape-determining protein MreC [Gammaproteobacteria bacterium]|nr:MAG: rod shape-determining protein MreC [Gammaproteobacteria bacterium]
MVAVALSVGLLLADHQFRLLDPLKRSLDWLQVPIHGLVNLPGMLWEDVGESVRSREALEEENAALKARLRILEAKTERLVAMTAEVNRLRELLNASRIVENPVAVAEIIGINPDPYLHEVLINKGASDGAYEGQPVLDSSGLMGQITFVGQRFSRALLISDATHAVPVQVNRNGIRGVLVGKGRLDELELVNVPQTADIQEGDLLVTSGLGGRFPAGYPVAVVSHVEHDPSEPYAKVTATPKAELNRTRHVLLVRRTSELPGGS